MRRFLALAGIAVACFSGVFSVAQSGATGPQKVWTPQAGNGPTFPGGCENDGSKDCIHNLTKHSTSEPGAK